MSETAPVSKNRFPATPSIPQTLFQHLRQHWFFDLVQIGAILLAVYWSRTNQLPVPGWAIGILALLAAVMSLHTSMGKWHKAIWILLMGLFLLIEFRAIAKDRNDFALAEKNRRD